MMYYYCYTILRYWKELHKNHKHNITSLYSEHIPTLTGDAIYAQHFQNDIFQRAEVAGNSSCWKTSCFFAMFSCTLLMRLKVFWTCGKKAPAVEILSG